MARKRASMREGPLAELFRATEAAQRQAGDDPPGEPSAPPAAEPDEQQTLIQEPSATTESGRRHEAALEETVEHVHDFDEEPSAAATPSRSPVSRTRQPS